MTLFLRGRGATACFLLAVACSGLADPVAGLPASSPAPGSSADAPEAEMSLPGGSNPSSPGVPPAGASGAPGVVPGEKGPKGRADDREAPEERALYPASGEYVYAQQGYEQYCRAGSCEQQDLPKRQTVNSTLGERGPRQATVVTEARVSDSRFVRTTIEHSRTGALITRVVARFSYGSFSFENTYEPRPPVEALRLPLDVGDRWSGSWSAQTSGDYEFFVAGKEKVRVAGRSVEVFRLNTHTTFRGEFEGEADIVSWVDTVTLAVVKTVGAVDLRSTFGRLRTRFTTLLRRAPGWQ